MRLFSVLNLGCSPRETVTWDLSQQANSPHSGSNLIFLTVQLSPALGERSPETFPCLTWPYGQPINSLSLIGCSNKKKENIQILNCAQGSPKNFLRVLAVPDLFMFFFMFIYTVFIFTQAIKKLFRGSNHMLLIRISHTLKYSTMKLPVHLSISLFYVFVYCIYHYFVLFFPCIYTLQLSIVILSTNVICHQVNT